MDTPLLKNRKWWLKTTIAFLGFLFIWYVFQLPVTYKTQDISGLRLTLPISILFLFIVTFIWVWTLPLLQKRSWLPLEILLIFQIYSVTTQWNLVIPYAEAHDSRITLLKQQQSKHRTEKFVLPCLPPSGWLYSAEISSDVTHFSNQHLKLGLNLDFDVVVDKECDQESSKNYFFK